MTVDAMRRIDYFIGVPLCFVVMLMHRLIELPSIYSIASFMLSNDSGPAHFAAVTPLPTYVIFGPETPRLYGPLGNSAYIHAGMACSPCESAFNHRKTLCTDNVCLQSITPHQVFDILTPCLER